MWAQVATPLFSHPNFWLPEPKLTLGSDGHFYGTLAIADGNDNGCVFKLTREGVFSTLVSFDGANSSRPSGALVEGPDGCLYGTTLGGGASFRGNVFKVSLSGSLTPLHSFSGLDGKGPTGEMVLGSDGKFYGTTASGGQYDNGTVFSITSAGAHTLLFSFNHANGDEPTNGLVEGESGVFYGTTANGGAHGAGTVFRITSSGQFTTLFHFGGEQGIHPYCTLLKGMDGAYYGTTQWGGAQDKGTVFKISPVGELSTLVDFTGANGSHPSSGLVYGPDGNIFGVTPNGGESDSGTLFGITQSGRLVITMQNDVDGFGWHPSNSLLFADGMLYGSSDSMKVWRVRFPKRLASRGADVPGAGVTGSGIPAGALWHKLGVPAMGEGGQMALWGEWNVGTTRGSGLFYQASLSSPLSLLATQGAAVPGVTNAVFSAFKDPLVAPDGAVVWHSTLGNAPGTTGAVKSSNNAAIFLNTSGIVARKGDVAAGTTSARWASFDSIAVSESAVAFLGKLVLSSSSGVSESSDQGLWIYDRDTATTSLMIREGDVLLGSKVKMIGALATRTKAGGQGRGVMTSSSEDQIALRITLTNGKTALGVVSSPGGLSFPYQSGMSTVGFGTGALWSSFGLPGQNSPAGALCFLGTVKPGTGTATATNNIALFSEDDVTLSLT